MDKRVYLLTTISFVAGMVELIIGGILDLVATDLNISLSKTGLLITVFSLVFGIAAPILLVATSKIERKKITSLSLLVFFIGNVIAVFSQSYSVLMISRVMTAASAALLTVLCITIASSIVAREYVGRAIGIVSMGISGSLVLGVPFGLLLGNTFGWRAPFILISVLTLCLMIGIHFFMNKIEPSPSVPLGKQIATLKNNKILFAHLAVFLFLSGHSTLYAYLTPFLKTTMGVSTTMVSAVYFIYGIAAISGGGIGGSLSDRFGSRAVMLTVISIFALSMFIIPYTTFALPVFLLIMIIWGMMSWSLTPAMQSYLIESAPETAATHQSLNNSALHFGIAFGSFIGGMVIEHTSVVQNATFGGLFVTLALGAAIFSLTRDREKNFAPLKQDGRT